jgi:hypothetical protein
MWCIEKNIIFFYLIKAFSPYRIISESEEVMKHRSFLTLPLWGFSLALLLAACAFSSEQALQKVLGASAEAPVFLGVRAISDRELCFEFSKPVTLSTLYFDPTLEVESVQEGTAVDVTLKGSMGAGEKFTADILVEDSNGNTLGVLIPFRSRNNRIPRLLITELRTEYANPKAEFVELKTLEAGNLGALRVFIAGTGMKDPVYEFPPAEVAAGEYIVLHLRSPETGAVDETGADRSISGGTEALPDARDFWVPESIKRLRKTDVVLIMDQDGAILDGALLSENPTPTWAKEDLEKASGLLAIQGAWVSASGGKTKTLSPADAISTKGTTATRTICRDEKAADSNSAADWYITATSKASPGKPNSTERYQP